MNGGNDGPMTLAFELTALQRLANPTDAFGEARRWSEYVGVVSDKPTYVVTNFTRKNRIRQDFFSGPRGKEESLDSVGRQFDTERHVFVGATDEDSAVAESVGWEYLPVEDAAAAAEWELGDPDRDEESEGTEVREDWP